MDKPLSLMTIEIKALKTSVTRCSVILTKGKLRLDLCILLDDFISVKALMYVIP